MQCNNSFELFCRLHLFVLCNHHSSVPRFQPDKEFAGTDRTQRRDGPVQFEKEEDDPFGLDKFLTEAKKGKRPLDEPSRSRYDYHNLDHLSVERFSFEGRKLIGFALFRYMIGLKISRQIFIQSELKLIVTDSHTFSRATRQLLVFSSSFDWFTVSFVTG